MRLFRYKNDLVMKHSHHTFIMYFCIKNTCCEVKYFDAKYFLWCEVFLQSTSCDVKYFDAKYLSISTRSTFCDVFLWKTTHIWFFGLAVVRRPADTFHVELVRASARILYAREILRSCARSYLAIACTIVRTNFLVGPGFEPLALHAIFFVGPGFDSLTLQHDLFVGPGFDSWTQSPVSGP